MKWEYDFGKGMREESCLGWRKGWKKDKRVRIGNGMRGRQEQSSSRVNDGTVKEDRDSVWKKGLSVGLEKRTRSLCQLLCVNIFGWFQSSSVRAFWCHFTQRKIKKCHGGSITSIHKPYGYAGRPENKSHRPVLKVVTLWGKRKDDRRLNRV